MSCQLTGTQKHWKNIVECFTKTEYFFLKQQPPDNLWLKMWKKQNLKYLLLTKKEQPIKAVCLKLLGKYMVRARGFKISVKLHGETVLHRILPLCCLRKGQVEHLPVFLGKGRNCFYLAPKRKGRKILFQPPGWQ